jgi:hypothetical protein
MIIGFISLAIAICCGSMAVIGPNYEVVAVWLMRKLRIYAYPTAIRIAVSLERDGEEWSFAGDEAKHPRIGTIRHFESRYSLTVWLDGGQIVWEPNAIERQIIRSAARATFRRHIETRLSKVLQT